LLKLVDGLTDADAFAVDARLRRALAREQCLEAGIAPLLVLAWQPGVHRDLGFASRDAWVRERLGMDPTRARALVRLERACAESPPLARAWRTGLSWVKASALVPLVSADPLGRFVADWVPWAARVTVRRLRDDVEQALAMAETDPEAFRDDGGLPPEARRRPATDEARDGAYRDREIRAIHRDSRDSHPAGPDARDADEAFDGAGREIRADHRDSQRDSHRDRGDGWGADAAFDGADREIRADHRISQRDSPQDRRGGPDGGDASAPAERGSGAPWNVAARAQAGLGGKPRPDETCWVRLIASPDVVRLFRAVLCTVRRRIEANTGRLPTAGEALDAMLDHAFAAWGAEAKIPARHRVFARDGWCCAAPGCSSMQNLHDHHVRFRSAGGSNAPQNRVTLCAFHHLRGVHAGRLRCVGRAPDGLTWQMGIRAGAPPLLSYRSGDILTATAAS
jgi:hypothetical protein